MSIQTYYRWALLLPLVLPLMVLTALLTDDRPVLLFWLGGSLLIGGPAYVLFAIGFLLWSRGRSELEVRRAVWLSPLFFAVALAATWAVWLLATGAGVEQWSGLETLGGVGVVFGYAYVLLAEALRLIVRHGRRGRVAPG